MSEALISIQWVEGPSTQSITNRGSGGALSKSTPRTPIKEGSNRYKRKLSKTPTQTPNKPTPPR